MSAFDEQLDLLRVLVASSSTFQTLTGSATVAAAKMRVAGHEALDDEYDGEIVTQYPRAIVSDGGVIQRERQGTGCWGGNGSLFLLFQITTPTDKVSSLSQREWFVDKASSIMREMEVIADSRAAPSGYSTSHLYIHRYRRTAGPNAVPAVDREHEESNTPQPPLWEMEFEVEF